MTRSQTAPPTTMCSLSPKVPPPSQPNAGKDGSRSRSVGFLSHVSGQGLGLSRARAMMLPGISDEGPRSALGESTMAYAYLHTAALLSYAYLHTVASTTFSMLVPAWAHDTACVFDTKPLMAALCTDKNKGGMLVRVS
eukprot:2830523-Rhodomonas_salina.1